MLFKRTSIIIAFLLISVTTFSQQTSLSMVKAQLDTMFASLDKTKVPTGFLWDTAVNMVERENYNGTALTDSNYVSADVMCDLLYSINSASVGADTIGIQAAITRLQRNSSSSTHAVGILFQPYNYIVENALADNLIVYSNDLVGDSYMGGVWQNPYSEDVLFGYAIGEERIVSTNAIFSFTNIDSLSTRSFQGIQFDPGDGYGFRCVSFGDVLMVNYADDGYHLTKLKVTYGGIEYQSHGYVFVIDNNSPQHSQSEPIYTSIERGAEHNGVYYKCKVTYKAVGGFNNPLIVSEGFDPWRMKSSDATSYEGYTTYIDFISPNTNGIDAFDYFDDLDLFYIDWFDYGADIRANAEVLKEVIRWINENKTSDNKNIILGQSMGGLIARYALRDMELAGEPHDTKLFISHDVPYKGANVSPGLMCMYRDLYDITDNAVGQLYSCYGKQRSIYNELIRFGSYQSVKQMTPNYVDGSWQYNTAAFNQLQEEFALMGFPKGDPGYPIENIAIINGGNAPSGSPSFFSSGDKLVNIHLKVSSGVLTEILAVYPILMLGGFFSKEHLMWIPGKSTLLFNYSVYPYLSNNSTVSSVSLVFTKKFLWLIDKNYVLRDRSFLSPSSGVPLDAVRSSYYSKAIRKMIPEPDSNNNYWLGDYEYSFDVVDRIAFIPVASAFASSEYYRDFLTNHPAPIMWTPFSSYIMPPDTSTYHTSFYKRVGHWLETVEGMSISGPLMPRSGDVYTMPSEYAPSFSWSTSNSKASISTSGTITCSGRGLVDIIARKDSANYVISKRKTILAGFPQMALTSSRSGTIYTVTAECDGDVECFLSETGLTDSLMRKWYLIVGGAPKDSVFNTNNTVQFTVADSVNIAYVSLIMSYQGRSSEPVYFQIKEKRNYEWNIVDIIRFSDQTVYLRRGALWCMDLDNPPYFKLRKNPSEQGVGWPAIMKATAGNNIIRTSGSLEIVNDCAIWDLFTEPAVLTLINTAYHSGHVMELVIDVYKEMDETEANLVQTIIIPIHPRVPPIPLE